MNRVLPHFPLRPALAEQMAMPLQSRLGRLDWRPFPGGESLVAIDGALEGADTAIMASQTDASAKLLGRSSGRTEAPALP